MSSISAGEKPASKQKEDIASLHSIQAGPESVDHESVNTASVAWEDLQKLDLDTAAQFLHEHHGLDTTDVNITKLRHKIDRRIVSIMCLCFTMQFLDKAIYNVSLRKK